MSHKIKDPIKAMYLQANVSYSILKLMDGQIQIQTRPLKFFASKLEEFGWCKIHKSFMVNPLYVVKLTNDRNSICMQDGQILPISRRNKKMVIKWRTSIYQ